MTTRQVEANAKYRQKIFDQYIKNGASVKVANQRAELAFAYNQGAHIGVMSAINAGLMGHCAMIWTTAGTNRVCPRCLALKGTVVGYTNETGVTLPPLHPRCRCTIEYRELTAAQGNANVSGDRSGIERKNFADLQDYLGKLDDRTVRKWYVCHDERIHEQIDQSLPIEQKARLAFELRNEYRTQARELMVNQEKRRKLDAEHPNKTWEEIIADKMNRKNLTYEEAVADIYQTAIKSNPEVNRKFNLE